MNLVPQNYKNAVLPVELENCLWSLSIFSRLIVNEVYRRLLHSIFIGKGYVSLQMFAVLG